MNDTKISEWMGKRIAEECKGLSPEDARATRLAMLCGYHKSDRDQALREVARLKDQLAASRLVVINAHDVIDGAIDPIEDAVGDLERRGGETRGLLDVLERLQTV